MSKTSVCALLLALATQVVAAGCTKGAGSARAERLVSDLSVFTSGEPLSAEDAKAKAKALGSGGLTIEAYVDGLLKEPMGARLAKDIVIAPNDTLKDRHPIAVHSILRSKTTDGEKVYFLREPCAPRDAVKVRPWWDDEEVLVCADSYRPDVRGDKAGRTCGASMLPPSDSECGCGPRLIYCAKDKEQYKAIQDAIVDEVVQTVGYVVNEDRPIEDVFLMNESVRNHYAEFVYRRARIAAGEPEAVVPVGDHGKKAKLAPRHEQIPGQHAGVLSTPLMTYASDALRGVMRNYSEYLWCAGVASSRVSTEGVMALEVVDLRVGDGWRQLASMEVCTDCHARLDYSMQFFWGYPSSTMGVDFRPKDVIAGKGKLYLNDIKDERGEDELTPAGFGRLAVAQPEFGTCMTRKVVDHVFNGTETAEDFKAVHASFKQTHRLKGMLKVAMMRYAERALQAPTSSAPSSAPVEPKAGSTSELVAVAKPLRTQLDAHCANCHDKGDPFDFSSAELPRATFALMMDQVGFGVMPMNASGLDEREREAFLDVVAPHAYADAAERQTALSFFKTGMRGHPVHRFRSAMQNVNFAAKGKTSGFRPQSIESAVAQSQMSYTPAIALSSAVTAVRACKEKRLEKEELAACIERASAPATVIVGGS